MFSVWGDTSVYWDVEDSSILNDLNVYLTKQNIKSDLADKGYSGPLSIYAYVDDNNTLPEVLLNKFLTGIIQIRFVPKGNKYETAHSMLLEVLSWALKNRVQPSNLIILSKNIKEEKKVTSVVEVLKEKYNYNIFFEEPGSLSVSEGTPFHQSGSSQTEPFHQSGSSQTEELPYCGYCDKSRKYNK